MIHEGWIKYLELSDEWTEKPMHEIKKYGTIYLVRNWWDLEKITGDDWDDSPAILNAGPPYGIKGIELEEGDRIIIIKNGLNIAAKEDQDG